MSVAVFATPLLVSAQSTDTAPPPPQMQRLEEGQAPGMTIAPPNTEKKITQKRSQGKVTEVKVQNGITTYYAKPNDPAGSALPGDAQSNGSRPVEFKIGEFGGPKTKPAPEPVETLAPAPAK